MENKADKTKLIMIWEILGVINNQSINIEQTLLKWAKFLSKSHHCVHTVRNKYITNIGSMVYMTVEQMKGGGIIKLNCRWPMEAMV